MATTDVNFTGLYHAAGLTVSVSVCGLDCGDYVVDPTGFITVPLNSDPDGNFNGDYLRQFDVGPYDKISYGDATTRIDMATSAGSVQTIYVPVVIGFTYPSVGMMLRPIGEDQTKTPQGPSLGKTRRTQWIGALLRNTQGITFGTENGIWDEQRLTDPAGNIYPFNTLFSGVWSKPLDDNDSLDGLVGWMVSRPYACSVVSITGYLETSER